MTTDLVTPAPEPAMGSELDALSDLFMATLAFVRARKAYAADKSVGNTVHASVTLEALCRTAEPFLDEQGAALAALDSAVQP